jgi:hypothetical protein
MLGPDREITIVPRLADAAQGRDEHAADDIDHRRPLVDEITDDGADRLLVAGDERVVYTIGGSVDPRRTPQINSCRPSAGSVESVMVRK